MANDQPRNNYKSFPNLFIMHWVDNGGADYYACLNCKRFWNDQASGHALFLSHIVNVHDMTDSG